MSKDSGYCLKGDSGWQEVPKEIFDQEKKAKEAQDRKEKVAWKITEAVGIYTPLAVISACFWPVGAALGAGYLASKGINAISNSQKEKTSIFVSICKEKGNKLNTQWEDNHYFLL